LFDIQSTVESITLENWYQNIYELFIALRKLMLEAPRTLRKVMQFTCWCGSPITYIVNGVSFLQWMEAIYWKTNSLEMICRSVNCTSASIRCGLEPIFDPFVESLFHSDNCDMANGSFNTIICNFLWPSAQYLWRHQFKSFKLCY